MDSLRFSQEVSSLLTESYKNKNLDVDMMQELEVDLKKLANKFNTDVEAVFYIKINNSLAEFQFKEKKLFMCDIYLKIGCKK